MSRIDVPYSHDDADGELGWLWDEDCDALGEGGWRLIATRIRDNVASLRFVDPDTGKDDADEWYDADEFLGRPYLSCPEPGADPGAPLMVQVRLEHGATATFGWEPEAHPEPVAATRATVMALLSRRLSPHVDLLFGKPVDSWLSAVTACRDVLYGVVRSDIESFAFWTDGVPDWRRFDRDDQTFMNPQMTALRAAEACVGRALPEGAPDWLAEAIDGWKAAPEGETDAG